MDTNRHEFYKAILSHSSLRCLKLRMTPTRSISPRFAFIRAHSWLKRKAEHFDGGGDFDVLSANDEVERAGALLAGRCLRNWGWRRRSASFARRTFVFFVVNVQRA